MNVFVSEYLCSGACKMSPDDASLLTEGAAMLKAVVADLLLIPGCRVTICVHESLQNRFDMEESDALEIILARDPAEEKHHFERACVAADVVWVIAPEFDGLLSSRTSLARKHCANFVGPDEATIQLTADKWELYQLLTQQNLPTIPTALLSDDHQSLSQDVPCLLKYRYGAGGMGMRLIRSTDEWHEIRSDSEMKSSDYLMQPFVPGKSYSIVALIDDGQKTWFPIGEQRICWDNGFEYQGGLIPARLDPSKAIAIQKLVSDVCECLPGLVGYAGFDILLTHHRPDQPLLVEINPRLTTSYVGYRQLTVDNLAERIVKGISGTKPLAWKSGMSVKFQPDGDVCLTQRSDSPD